MERLTRDFFSRDTAEVARDLLGQVVVRELDDGALRGKIVEAEAYYGEGDPPSHASSGKTPRSEIMWGEPGLVYVYLVYGVHLMFNVVTEAEGSPGATLIRAVKPLSGVEKMRENRGVEERVKLTNGPGKLTEAFGIDRGETGLDLTESSALWVEAGSEGDPGAIETSGRIGVSEGKDEPLRFYLKESRYVSEA